MGAFDDIPATGAFDDLPEKKKPERGTLQEILGGVAEPLAAMGSGAVAKPVSEVMGMAAMLRDMLSKEPGAGPQEFQQHVQQALTYEPKTAAGASPANPLNLIPNLLGKGVNWAAEKAGSMVDFPDAGPGRQGLVRGVEEAVRQAPGFVGAKAPAAGTAVKELLQGENKYMGARGMMGSALKASDEVMKSGQAADAITTMLDKGINVSRGGLEKLKPMIDALDTEIADKIKNSSAMIDPEIVATRLVSTLDKFKKQALRKADVATVKKAWDEFLDEYHSAIPIQEAQAVKQGTYRRLQDKAYTGEPQLSANVDAQKSLARGLKEEIATAEPSVAPLNEELSKYLNAQGLIEPRVFAEARHNPAGIGWINPKTLLLHALDRSGPAKSMIARLLNVLGEGAPGAAAGGPYAGMAVTQQANDEQRKRLIAEMLAAGGSQ